MVEFVPESIKPDVETAKFELVKRLSECQENSRQTEINKSRDQFDFTEFLKCTRGVYTKISGIIKSLIEDEGAQVPKALLGY